LHSHLFLITQTLLLPSEQSYNIYPSQLDQVEYRSLHDALFQLPRTPCYSSLYLNDPRVSNSRYREARERAHCWPGSNIKTSDIEALHNDLQSRGGDFFLGRQSSVTYTYGTARVCIDNNYIFETTQASDWEAGWGVKQMKEECCHGDTCGGGIGFLCLCCSGR
jgi:hypothetical protein